MVKSSLLVLLPSPHKEAKEYICSRGFFIQINFEKSIFSRGIDR